MKNSIKVTHKGMMINFEFPIEVGQVKLDAICQVYVYKDKESGLLQGDFEFMDQDNETYMGMPVDGYKAWNKLKDHHLEFGVDLQKLTADEFNKVVTDKFQKEFLSQFDVRNFEI